MTAEIIYPDIFRNRGNALTSEESFVDGAAQDRFGLADVLGGLDPAVSAPMHPVDRDHEAEGSALGRSGAPVVPLNPVAARMLSRRGVAADAFPGAETLLRAAERARPAVDGLFEQRPANYRGDGLYEAQQSASSALAELRAAGERLDESLRQVRDASRSIQDDEVRMVDQAQRMAGLTEQLSHQMDDLLRETSSFAASLRD